VWVSRSEAAYIWSFKVVSSVCQPARLL
jgi:hypothetical protein